MFSKSKFEGLLDDTIEVMVQWRLLGEGYGMEIIFQIIRSNMQRLVGVKSFVENELTSRTYKNCGHYRRLFNYGD